MEDNLTQEELDRINSVVNSEKTTENVKYEFNSDLQEEILSMLLQDRMFTIQSLGLIKPDYFVAEAHSYLCRLLFGYFEEYGDLPPIAHLLQEIKSTHKIDAYYRYAAALKSAVGSYTPGMYPRDFLLEKITQFAKQQAMKVAIVKTCDLLRSPKTDWEKVYDTLRYALNVGPYQDIGMDYFTEAEKFLDHLIELDASTERFSSGFPPIDQLITGGGLARGEIGAFMGMSGAGKSLALVQAAVINLMNGKKVLYISTEMDQTRVAERFTSHFTFLPQRDLHLYDNRELILGKINDRLQEMIGQGLPDKKRLWIKQFPAGTADINTIRAYTNQLSLRGFKPDLVIVDYVGELKDYEGIKTYESRQRLVRDLRAYGVEEKFCVLTAMQPNRQGRTAQEEGRFIDDSEIGDSYGQIRPLDACWSINQSREEQKAYVGKIFVVKHRNGESRKSLYYMRVPYTLGMKIISESEWDNAMNKVKSDAANVLDLPIINATNIKSTQTEHS